MKKYLLGAGEAISQLGHAVLFGGSPNITISARCYLERRKPIWRTAYKVINWVFFLQVDHCRDSWVSDIDFARKALLKLEAEQGAQTAANSRNF